MDSWMMLLKTVGSLALVLATIFVFAWVFRRFLHQRPWAGSQEGIRITRSLDLGAKKKLMVVEFGGREILVGLTDMSFSRLAERDLSPSSANTIRDEGVQYAKLS